MNLFLSCLHFDPNNRVAATNLSRPYELHRTLLQAFPNKDRCGPGRVLFRTEPLQPMRTSGVPVIVQSEKEPDWTKACRYFPKGLLLAKPKHRDLPTTFQVGTVLKFRLRANPTVRRARLPDGTRDERKKRPRHPLYREEDQLAWLIRQGERHGFEPVASDKTDWFDTEASCAQYELIIIDEGTMLTGKKTNTGVSRHHSVMFEGRLIVTKTTHFSRAIQGGIGPGKAFGFGLLSVAPG